MINLYFCGKKIVIGAGPKKIVKLSQHEAKLTQMKQSFIFTAQVVFVAKFQFQKESSGINNIARFAKKGLIQLLAKPIFKQ